MRRSTTALIFGVALSAGVFSGVAVAQQQSPVPGMSSDDLNTALDFAKAGLNKAIDQARAYTALPIKDPRDVRYTCEGGKTLAVKYMTVGDTPLASMVLDGKTLVFANVIAASGARYASGQYVWWTKGPTGFLTDETLPAGRNTGNVLYRDCNETTR
ncbi:MliC family protein [Ralstonia insidiosa]|uniref:Lysozyme inhibitor n=1 Tax=Ralstonia insidiosa TaxID=190721 RepID=A0A848NW73_9RALS|nr:MliC family protein [Ralstonia insidiosa]NMV37447.1 lysozyme inhibitor [Ralstonia insidiosa]